MNARSAFDDNDNRSFLFLHPVELDRVVNVAEMADAIIDHAGVGYPAQTFGDVSKDGIPDLGFVRDGSSGSSLQIVTLLGKQFGSGELPHLWDRQFADRLDRFDVSKDLFASPATATAADVNLNAVKLKDAAASNIVLTVKHTAMGRPTTGNDRLAGFAYDYGQLLGRLVTQKTVVSLFPPKIKTMIAMINPTVIKKPIKYLR